MTTVLRLAVALLLIGLCAHLTWAADEKPKLTVTVLEPPADTTLTGAVRVVAEVSPADAVPTHAYVSLAGPPYRPLRRLKGTNRWTAQIDTTLVPNGPADLLVIARTDAVKRGQQTVKVTLANPLRNYFGDIHSHTFYSDGSLIPAEAYSYARKVSKLDFFILADHLELVDDNEWCDIREQAFKATEEGRFIALPGLEWTTKNGHACLLDPPGRIWPREVAALYQTGENGTHIGMFNHPGDGAGVFEGLAYSAVGDKAMQLMEVRSDSEQLAYLRALNAGWHIAAAGTDDTHAPNWGAGRAWTGILAPGLSRLTVWSALRNRHCYGTTDRNCQLSFRLGEAVMGDIIEAPLDAPCAVVQIADPDPRDSIAKAELFLDGEVAQTVEPGAPAFRWQTAPVQSPGKHNAFIKVTQADGQMLWSAPIWFEVKPE